MHIGILSARSPKTYPNRRLVQAAFMLGHSAAVVHPKTCFSEIRRGSIRVKAPERTAAVDVILPRIGATIKDSALTLLRQFELSGIPVVNGTRAIGLARNKFAALQALAEQGVRVPYTYFVSNVKTFRKAVKILGGYPVVIKTPQSRQGTGVALVDSQRTGEFFFEHFPAETTGMLVQEYLPPDHRHDIRAFVIGGRVVAAIVLRPRKGDFRANLHLRGSGAPVKLDKKMSALAVRTAEAMTLEISGVDIIVQEGGSAKVLEANYSPGFRGLEAISNQDIAAEIVRYIAGRYGNAL